MQIQSFNAELAIANLMFLRLFNNIIIERNSNNKQKQIKVNCQLGQRSRIYKNWQNAEKRAQMKLPMIVIDRTGYVRNGERLNNLHNEVKYEVSSKDRRYDLLTPIPIDISYDVTIMSKYPSDIDQIASNFMIFFNSDVYVSCVHPKYEDIKLNNQVIMSDSITEEHPDELDATVDDFITATFQFTFKTYLFGGNQQAKKMYQPVLSTYTKTTLSTYEYKLTDEDKENLDKFKNKDLYMKLSKKVQETLSTYVDSDIKTDMYDGFTPIIQSLNVGFYPVPQLSNYTEHFDYVDNQLDTDHQWPHVDRLIWKINEQ